MNAGILGLTPPSASYHVESSTGLLAGYAVDSAVGNDYSPAIVLAISSASFMQSPVETPCR
jgi:hypothetical protein